MLDRIKRCTTKEVGFGPFRLLPYQRLLQREKPVPLGRRALDILTALVERPGEFLTKDELMSRIWPDITVEAANVTVHIAALRRALGDGTEGRRYVVTVPGRGYTFVAPVAVDVPLPPRPDEPQGITMRLAKGEELFGEGEPAEHFYKVAIGTVRTYKALSDGRRQIDAFHLAGDIFGIEAGSEHRFSAEAVNGVTVIAWRRNRLDRLTREHPAFGKQVMASMINSLERAHDHMLLLGRKKAPEKIATFLLQLAERVDEDKELKLPMQRSDIADHLGLTTETVSRTLTELSRQGLIKLAASGRLVVLANKPALQVLNA